MGKGAMRKLNKRTPTQIERDRALIARLHYQGMTDEAIAEALNQRPDTSYTISRRLVTYDRNQLLKRWQETQVANTEQWVAEAMAELSAVKAEAWEQWFKSLTPRYREEVKEIQEVDEKGNLTGDLVMSERKYTEMSSQGNVSFLETIMRAQEQMNKLRGLYQLKVQIDSRHRSEHAVKVYHSFSPTQWDDPNVNVIDGEVVNKTPSLPEGEL